SGYITAMPSELRDLLSDLEVSLVDAVARRDQAERDLLFARVVEIERRIEALHDALASVVESIALQGPVD
ncbi:MAG: hypothetical protein LC792_13865, partial [Actinobacteria bacterium]|nr:hypothetical protein [Actinomycetota bacterium]